MRFDERRFDPHHEDPPPLTGDASTWEEFLRIPWVETRTRLVTKGWYISPLGDLTLSTWRRTGKIPYPYDERGEVQVLVGEREGYVLGYGHAKTIEEYEAFMASVPEEHRYR